VSGEQCDGGGGAGGGGGAQGGSAGLVEFGSGTSDEWFGLGGYPGQNSTGSLSGLASQYVYYPDNNANGSVVISYSSGAPGAPTSVYAAPGDASASLYWTAPSATGNTALSGYAVEYAASPYSTWVTAPMCTGTSTSCTVTGLTNATSYEFEVAAVNSIGQGAFSGASSPVTPSGPPGAPSISAIVPSDGSLSVSFSAATSSIALSDYQYSLDGAVTWTSGGVTSSPLTIVGLTNGTQYSVQIRGVSASGVGAPSAPASATPSALPGAPTITSITPGGNGTSLSVTFVPGYVGGSAITSYDYAISLGANTSNFGSWTSVSGTTSPFTIMGLSSASTYSVELRADNAVGPGPGSPYVTGVTLAVANAPSITSITPGGSSLQVTYAPYTSSTDGGSAISGVEYSLDGGNTWVTTGTLADPFTIAALVNGTAYGVELRADNGVGASAPSASLNATPRTTPAAPTQVQAVGGPSSTQISWSAPTSDGGAAVTGYTASAYASASGGSPVGSCTTATMTCQITGLVNDTSYFVDVVANNPAGPGPASSPRVSALPAALPGAPTLSPLTAGNSYVSVPFTPGTQDTNAPITGYQYSLDAGATWVNASGSNSPLLISGLINGTGYTVELRALSSLGAGGPSNSETATPYAAPDPTDNATTTFTAGSGQVTVSWLAPNDNGAAISSYTVTAFTAAISGTQQSTCTTAMLSCTLTGLTNGTTYYISIQSINVNSQYSLRSTPRIAVVPGTPSTTSLVVNPGSSNYGASVTLSATVTSGASGTVAFLVGGAPITNCSAVPITSGAAQCVTTALPVGTSIVAADYSGSASYASSVSATTTVSVAKVDQAPLVVSTTSSTYAPSPANSLTLASSGGTLNATVTYAVSNVSNSAGCAVHGAVLSFTSSGSCTISATMAGNTTYNPVSSGATLFTINPASSSTVLGANPTSGAYGTSVTLSATVTTGATGTVAFAVNSATIASCAAVPIYSGLAQCVTTTLPVGMDSLVATYSGDGNYQGSANSALGFSVAALVQGALSVTSVAGVSGADLVLSSSGGSSTGGVTYVVANGTATCLQPSPGVLRVTGVGTCMVTANKAGDTSHQGVSSATTTVTFKDAQAILFTTSAPSTARVNGSYIVGASSDSGLSVVLSIDPSSAAICSQSGASFLMIASGACVIDANQPGDATHWAGAQIQSTVVVSAAPSGGVVPSAPRNVSAVLTGTSALVTWSAPAQLGSSPVVIYVVTASPGGVGCTTTSGTSCTISGLTSGVAYTFGVVAFNRSGASTSATFATSSPGLTPGSPTSLEVTITNTSALVSWSAPSTGAASITKYVVTASPGALTCTTSGTTHCSLSGLANSTLYHFTVVAYNAQGGSLAAVSPNVVLTVPSVTVDAGLAFVSWSAAKSAPFGVAHYRITIEPGHLTCTTVRVTTCTISGAPLAHLYRVRLSLLDASGRAASVVTGPTRGLALLNVHFALGSAALSPSVRAALARLARMVVNDQIVSLTFYGHADSIGPRLFNVVLSRERAQAVAGELVARLRLLGYRRLHLHVIAGGVSTQSANGALDRNVIIFR
jgi:titin